MDDPEKNKILNEMNSLEYKIIWELETWKKVILIYFLKINIIFINFLRQKKQNLKLL